MSNTPVTPNDDQLAQSQPLPTQPQDNTPAAAPTTSTMTPAQQSAAPGQPAMPTQAPQTPPQQQPHPISRIFDGILRGMTGGPVTFVDASGQQRVAPQSRGTLSKTIVAAALAGLMSPDRYIETPYGPRRDFAGTAQGAAEASSKVIQGMRNAPQAQSDESVRQQTAGLMNLQRNADVMKTMSASALQGHQTLQTMIDSNKPVLDNLDQYETTRTPDMPTARIAQHLSKDDAMAKMQGNYLKWSAIADGTETILNPETGKNEEHPTYSIIDPNVKVPLNEEATNVLGLVSPQWAGIHKQVGEDTVKVPMGLAMSALNEVNKIHVTQNFADTIAKEFGVEPANVMSEIKGNRKLLAAVDNAQAQIASGSAPWRVLDAVRSAPNGADMLKVLGLTNKQADDYIVKKHTEEKTAESEALAEAKADAAAEVKANTPAGQADLKNKQLEIQLKQQQLNQNAAQSQGIEVPQGFSPHPDAASLGSNDLQNDLQKKGVKIPPNFDALYAIGHNAADLKTYSSSPRKGVNVMPQAAALSFIRQYINPQYQEGDYSAATGLSKELASTRQGTAGGSLLSAGVASNHLELLVQAADALKNDDIQALNRLGNTLGVATGKSSAVVFKAIADQVNQEVGKVVAGGQPHEAELANLRENLNSDQSPEQTLNVAKSYIGLMAGRVNEINDRSQQYFGRDVKGISPAVARVFNKYGLAVGSQVTVIAPNGKPYIFSDKAGADAFKKKAGIQ